MGQGQSDLSGLAAHPGEEGAAFTSPYDFEAYILIGKGSFGTVYRARHKGNHRIYALKELRKKDVIENNEVEHVKAERSILGTLDHPFLVHLYAAMQTPASLFLVLEYVPGGELYTHLQRMKEKHKTFGFLESDVKLIAAQLVLAIEYLHKQNIIIRDLKPENILLQKDGYIKITDFGLSKQDLIETLGAKTMAGTAEYFSPEQLQNSGHGKGVDLWALGTIIYELIAGLPPFYDPDKAQMWRKILRDKPTFSNKLFSPDAQSVITGLLNKQPQQRLGCRRDKGGIQELKKHRWFDGINWTQLYRKEYTMKYKPTIKDDDDVRNFGREFTDVAFEMKERVYQRTHGAEPLDETFADFIRAIDDGASPASAAPSTDPAIMVDIDDDDLPPLPD
ncbi:Kinase, AGC [Giardia muris]|uniref:Kinase, AGC n=1 Tax=Giardia muris TaxID=5742 RepID=A0A4Z1T3R1_GIAMU|nr:Kinase, AGC [Giardia muris]|eukprot:TNJ27687.1 Kinase, AGC [Giardia muris]